MIAPANMKMEYMLTADVEIDRREFPEEYLGGCCSMPDVWYFVEWDQPASNGEEVTTRGCWGPALTHGKLNFAVPLDEAWEIAAGVREACGLKRDEDSYLEKGKAVLFFYHINKAIESLRK